MDDLSDVVERARAARAAREWRRAYRLFTEAREGSRLSPEDLDRLSDAAWWLGHVDEFLEAGEGAFRGYLDIDRPREAAMTAVEMGVSLFLRGDDVLGSGWIARAQRLLEDLSDGPEHGYVRYVVEVEGGLDGGDLEAVVAAAGDVREIGRAHDDPNLTAGGVVGEGRALIRLGDVARGMRLLDEAMLAVVHDELDPAWAGNIYCHLMAACQELADIGRARRWTETTWSWVSDMPAAVLFTGICRVHRSQVHQVVGEWDRAEQEAARVLEDLDDLHVASVAEAHYQIGELNRLRGDLPGAERAYARARQLGRDPQPGVALLSLVRGRVDAAAAAIEGALHAVGDDRLGRARLCPAQVEVALASGDLESARRACAELEEAATTYGTSGLEAGALHCRGAVAVGEGRAEEALPALRAACRRWHQVGASYDAARACVLLGRAYGMLGDEEAALSEVAAARDTFAQLGAAVDERAARRIRAELTGDRSPPGGLTAREVEVLRLVASGRTNREVAEELVISEKTIARHLSNIYTKLDVSTRTEAAAFAFEHELARPGRG